MKALEFLKKYNDEVPDSVDKDDLVLFMTEYARECCEERDYEIEQLQKMLSQAENAEGSAQLQIKEQEQYIRNLLRRPEEL
jgi:hypothetical protein